MRALNALHRRLLPDNPQIGWTPYLWLVYLSFFFIRYLYVTPSRLELLAIVATLAAFLWLYFNGHWRRGWPLAANIAGLGALGLLWAPLNPGASAFIIFAAAFTGWLGPVRRGVSAVVLLVLATALVAWLWQAHAIFWMTALVFAPLVAAVNMYYAQQAHKDAALRLSQEEVRQLAQVAERERISRDLHDLLGHTLSVITLKSELAARLIERDPARAAAEVKEVEQVSRSALAQVREAVSGVRQRGLAGELEQAALSLKSAGVRLDVDPEVPPLPPIVEAVLAMVVREAVTNIIRHARATTCRIQLRAEDGEASLEVRDDGRGGRLQPGSGVEGMRERLQEVSGRLEIASDFGTRIRAWVPL